MYLQIMLWAALRVVFPESIAKGSLAEVRFFPCFPSFHLSSFYGPLCFVVDVLQFKSSHLLLKRLVETLPDTRR